MSQPLCNLKRQRIRQGFTLIEALVTLMFLAIVLPVAMRGISLASGAASLSRQRLIAINLAEQKLSELILDQAYQDRESSGDFTDLDQPDYAWTVYVEDFEADDLKQINLQVTWNFRNSEKSIALNTLIYTETP